MYFVPPEAFGTVEEGIYRSSDDITSINCPFLKNLGLSHILFLSNEVPSRVITKFVEDEGIRLVLLGWKPVSEELIKEGLEMVLDSKYHPILVMCTTGLHETGTFIGCLRKLQHWNFNSIVFEYRSFAGKRSRYYIEQFIELFDTDLINIPENPPKFFAVQQAMWEEEEVELLKRKWGSKFIESS
ncbi:hypothetical protein H4R34_000070 [Dimargaris verticillata]|uniref:Protein-tyrosine phosphatase n=1 Tax=Dimargaris verticillata TaxID=2761393 RepID=A0A9W8BDG0_9FUNG|nr:hypothetical protein H4R34_000070 [Dimargaris verticillata]